MKLTNTITFTLKIMIMSLALPALAHAGLILEPYAGYMKGTKGQFGSGATFGGRLGYGFGPVMAGGEFESGNFSGSNLKTTEINAYAGVRVPFGPVALLGYTVSNTATGLTGSGGLKALLGYKILPVVQLNGEYVVRNYKGTGQTAINSFQVTVSFPLELP